MIDVLAVVGERITQSVPPPPRLGNITSPEHKQVVDDSLGILLVDT
jgi:hypothetical protein